MDLNLRKMRDQFIAKERVILIILGYIVIAVMFFVFGIFKGVEISPQPITIREPHPESVIVQKNCTEGDGAMITQDSCIYVGSTKGTKYYPPTCAYAQNIAKENLRCFISDQDALDKGYTKSTSCN